MVHHEDIEIRLSRVASAVGAVPFAILVCVLLDAMFVGYLPIDNLGSGSVEWSLLFAFGLGLLWCLKTVLFPSLMLKCDRDGLTFGRGVLFNKTRLVRWDDVRKITESDMTVFVEKDTRRVGEAHYPAVRVLVSDSIDLGNSGFKFAYPERRQDFRIAAHLFRQPLDDTVNTLNEMKTQYTSGDG